MLFSALLPGMSSAERTRGKLAATEVSVNTYATDCPSVVFTREKRFAKHSLSCFDGHIRVKFIYV